MFDGLTFKTYFPDGIYSNSEPRRAIDLIFADMNDMCIKKFPDLHKNRLNEKIYYPNNSISPFIKDNITYGSVFENCYIPSNAYNIICKNNFATIELMDEPKITLNQYIDTYYKLVLEQVEKIYTKHDTVVLKYSGGIDSIAIFSYILKLGYLERTIITKYENYYGPEHQDYIRYSVPKSNAIKNFKKQFSNKYIDFLDYDFTIDDWIDLANSKTTFTAIRAYANFFLFQKFKNSAFITGHHGDQFFLHDRKWLGNFIAKSDDKQATIAQFKKHLENKNLYMNNLLHIDYEKDAVPLEHWSWYMKRWDEFSVNNNIYYTPIAVDTRMCRNIDLKTIDILDVLDARVAREIIHRNCGNLLDEYIIHTGDYDSDYSNNYMIEKSKLADHVLRIPKNLKHNGVGLTRLLRDLQGDHVSTYAILSCHNLNYINNLLNWNKNV